MLQLYQCRQDSASNAPPTGTTRWRRGIGAIAGLLMTMAATAASASTPYLGSPFSEPGTQINAVDFDAGSAGDAYSVANPVSPASTTYRNTPVPLSTTTDPGRGFAVGVNIVPGDWLAYSTNFTTGGSFDITFRAATANSDGTGASGRFVHLEVDGTNVTGSINLPATGSWNSYGSVTVSSVAIPSGSHKLKLVVDSPVGLINVNYMTIVQHQTFTYYVSPSGNDGNNGTSTSTPWRTLAKVNSAALGPGDTVLFQRGGEWHESLNPLVDGRPSNPITFADYGTGNKPRFWGSDFIPVNDSGWVPQGGNVYTHAWSQQVNSVLANHQFLIDIFNGGTGDGSVVRDPSTTPNCWKWSGGTLTISTNGSDPRTDGRLYSVCVRDNVICNGNQLTFNLHSHLVFRNLVVDECGSNANPTLGYGCRITGNGTTTGIDVLVDGVEVYRYGRHGFAVIDGSQVTFNNCYAAYPMPNEQTGQTAYVSYGDQGPTGTETSVYNNCVAEHQADTWNGAGDFEYQAFTDHGPSLGSVTLNNFQAIDSGGNGTGDGCTFDGASGATITVKGGICYSAQVQSLGPNVTIDGMKIYGPNASMDIAGSGTVVQNCLVVGTSSASPYNSAVWLRGPNPIFRFNTVATASTAGTSFTALSLASLGSTNGTNAQVYGNVLYAPQLSVNSFTSSNTFNAAMVKDNLYNNGATFQLNFGTVWNLSQWQTQGYDAGSIQTATPGFSNPAAFDYSLTSTSPAINAAPVGTTTPAMPGLDFLGNPRKVGANYDIGAYEYQGGGTVSPPVINSAATASGTQGTAFSYQIVASNSPTSYSATGLPAGLSVNTSTGLISGTPTGSGTSTVTLGATNSGGTGNKTLTITISASTPATPVISSATTASGTVGTAFSYQIVASNSPTSYSATGLPASLAINTSTGLISGTPSAAGTSTVTLGATNAGGTGHKTLTITINTSGSTAYNVNAIYTTGTTFTTGGLDSYGNAYVSSELGTSITYNGSSFTFGAANALDAWSNTTVNLPTGTYTTLNMVGTASGGIANSQTFTVTYTDNSTQSFTANMTDWTNGSPLAGETKIKTMADAIASNGTLTGASHYLSGYTFTLNGKTPKTITLPAARGVVIFGFAAGTSGSAPSITSATTASGNVNMPFSYQITATNTPTSYSATGLPAGLSVNTSTGVISGTPSAAGNSTVTIGATNAGGTGTATLTITVAAFSSTAYNVNATYTTGTTFTTGGLDTYGNAYAASDLGTSATFNGNSFTFASPNALDGWSNTTVNLPAGSYTTLNMLGCSSGGIATNQTFTVTYTDNTTQSFTLQMSDWTNGSGYAGETNVVTMAHYVASTGTLTAGTHYVKGYTFTLNGKTPKSITLPSARGVVAVGFAGH